MFRCLGHQEKKYLDRFSTAPSFTCDASLSDYETRRLPYQECSPRSFKGCNIFGDRNPFRFSFFCYSFLVRGIMKVLCCIAEQGIFDACFFVDLR